MAENGFRAFQRDKVSPQNAQINTISCIFLPKIKLNTVKRLKRPLKKKTEIGFMTDYRLMQVKTVLLSTLIKLLFVFKIVFVFFE